MNDIEVETWKRQPMALLRLGKAKLALYAALVDVRDGMHQQQRLAEDNEQGKRQDTAARNGRHGKDINTGWILGNGM